MFQKKFYITLSFLLMSSCALVAQSTSVPASEEFPSTIFSDEEAIDTFMPLVMVGNEGNRPDPDTGHGSVKHSFSMGRFEVTADQYCTFLNAVASTADPYQLYDPRMGSDEAIKCITRSQGEAPYTYSIIEDGKNRGQFPITYITLYSAARFCNWMEQGRPSQDPEHRVTESGAYTLNGAMRGPLARVSGATWFIPSEEELYKSIYYKGGSLEDGYYPYPNRSLSYPGHTIGKTNNEANCRDAYSYGPRNKAPYLTPVGIFVTSVSAYNAHDTGGNVDQWTIQQEGSQGSALFYVIRGGSWRSSYSYSQENDLQKEVRRTVPSTTKRNTLGFRIASSFIAVEKAIPATIPPAESQWTTDEMMVGIFGLLGSVGVGGCSIKKRWDSHEKEREIPPQLRVVKTVDEQKKRREKDALESPSTGGMTVSSTPIRQPDDGKQGAVVEVDPSTFSQNGNPNSPLPSQYTTAKKDPPSSFGFPAWATPVQTEEELRQQREEPTETMRRPIEQRAMENLANAVKEEGLTDVLMRDSDSQDGVLVSTDDPRFDAARKAIAEEVARKAAQQVKVTSAPSSWWPW